MYFESEMPRQLVKERGKVLSCFGNAGVFRQREKQKNIFLAS